MLAMVLEADRGSDDEVLHGRGHDRLPGVRVGHHARADVDRDAFYVSIGEVDLSGVEARSNVDPDRAQRLVDRLSTSDRAGRTVERREESITRRLHLPPLESIERLTDEPIVLGQELAPPGVSHPGRAVGRADD